MTRRSTAGLILGLLILTVAGPAGAQGDDPVAPEYRNESVYFHCQGGDEEKVQNAHEQFAWDGSRPHRLLSDGAGCTYLNSGLTGDAPTFAGTFTGNLRDLTVDLHTFPSAVHARALATGGIDLHVTLVIDGEVVVDGTLPAVPAPLDGNPPPIAPDGNWWLTQTVRFGISGLGVEFGQEDGVGEAVRDIALTVGTASAEEIVSWAWDTGEVPAGIRFNTAGNPTLPVSP